MSNYKIEENNIAEIIIIDDDYLNNFINQKIIEKHFKGKSVSVFENVDDALQYLSISDRRGNFLIFLDINMPIKDGWDFLDEYTDYKVKSPVIVLTSSLESSDQSKSKTYDIVKNFFIKPLSYHQLIEITKDEQTISN